MLLSTRSLPEAVVLGISTTSGLSELPPEGIFLEKHLEGIGKSLMLQALERCDGVQTQAAELLQMSTRSFRYYAKKLGITAGLEEAM